MKYQNEESDYSEEDYREKPNTSLFHSFVQVFARVFASLVLIVLIGYGVFATFKIISLQGQLNALLRKENKVEVTTFIVKERLNEIGELATEAYEYNGVQTISNARQMFGWTIPGTTNIINVTYDGVVKVGFDVTEIHPDVNQVTQKIYITLPDPKVLDSYIKLDELQFDAQNNILNPIDVTKLTEYFGEIEKQGLSNAEEKDIFDKAEKRMELLIESFLAVFPEYEVVFV